MKKLKLLSLLVIIAVTGCQKKSDDSSTPAPAPTTSEIGAVPATFTQKVMIEENTGAWCGWCVLGAEGIKTAEQAYPERVNAVAIHGGSASEPMTVPEFQALLTFSGASGVPHYQLNRGLGGGFPGSFSSRVASALSQVANCGLAINAKASSGNDIAFTVHAGFKTTLVGDYRLMVYLVEDSVQNSASSYNQSNYVSNDPNYTSSAYYSLPATITNYAHKHVARKLLSASLIGGDQIPAASVQAGMEFTKTYNYTVTGNWNTSNLRVVAAILKYNASCASQLIVNSQSVKVGSVKNWD